MKKLDANVLMRSVLQESSASLLLLIKKRRIKGRRLGSRLPLSLLGA